MNLITSFLFSESRRRVLALLLLHAESRYHVREIARLTNTDASNLNKELGKLAKAQVLIREASGHQVYYRANKTYPLYEELLSILKKTSGLADILANCLIPYADQIEVAFVYGSVSRNTENSRSDIDVLIIGDINFSDAVAALYPAQSILGREINPTVYMKKEWQKLSNNRDPFILEILHNSKIYIIGEGNDLN